MNKLNKTIDLSKIYNIKIVQIVVNILFSLSTASLTAILIVGEYSSSVLDIVLPTLSFCIMLFICFKFNLLKKVYTDRNKIILFISIFLGIYALIQNFPYMMDYSTTYFNILLVVFSAFAVITFLYYFYTKLWYYFKLFIKSLDKLERNFLITSTCIFIVAIIVIYNLTSVFTKVNIPDENRRYFITYSEENEESKKQAKQIIDQIYSVITGNLIYTFDTQFLLNMDVYNNINADENDVRQPFFGIFSLPYTILPKYISSISFAEIYLYLIAIVQGFIILVSIILLEKMMKLKGAIRLIFMIFLCISYPTLLFLINMEQYVIHVFYLITFIYFSINKMKDKDMVYIMSTGTLITSGIFFPLLGEKGNIKKSIKNIFFTLLKFIAIFIISAKILLVLPSQLKAQMNTYSNFYGEETVPVERLNMYTHFILNTIIAPEISIDNSVFASKAASLNGYEYRILAFNIAISQTNNKSTNILGIIIFAIAILGFIFNRKDSFSKICFVWVLFSVILLPIIGYGSGENGFLLYSYYFSWAFICLIFKLFEFIFKNHTKLKNTLCTLLIIPVAIINFYGIYQLIIFGIQNY